MTEDDTFRALKRIPVQEMARLWNDSPIISPAGEIQGWSIETSVVPQEVEDFFHLYGWNYKLFLRRYYPHYKND